MATAVILGVAAAIWFSQDRIIHTLVIRSLEHRTGLPVRLDSARADWSSGLLALSGLRIINASEFGTEPFLDVPRLQLHWDLDALRHGRFHLAAAELTLQTVNVVTSRQGRTNWIDFLAHLDATSDHPGQDRAHRKIPFGGVDRLTLNFGVIQFRNLSRPDTGMRTLRLDLTNAVGTDLKTNGDISTFLLTALFRHGIPFWAVSSD